ncbi:MAG: succinate dehydrogenase, hydrophobic membrane anchor protein [Alphaproteobacteria bacterium]
MVYFFSKTNKPTRHWWGQRLSALMMLVAMGFIVVYIVKGSTIPILPSLYDNYLSLVIAMLFLLLFYHGRLGFDMIIEDYIHSDAQKKFWLFINHFLCWLFKLLTIALTYYIFKGIAP